MIKRSYFYKVSVFVDRNNQINLSGVYTTTSWFADHQKTFRMLMASVEVDHKTTKDKLEFVKFERLR